jgi:hypothetical protein
MVRGSYCCYLLGCDLVLVKEGRGREEKHGEVETSWFPRVHFFFFCLSLALPTLSLDIMISFGET